MTKPAHHDTITLDEQHTLLKAVYGKPDRAKRRRMNDAVRYYQAVRKRRGWQEHHELKLRVFLHSASQEYYDFIKRAYNAQLRIDQI